MSIEAPGIVDDVDVDLLEVLLRRIMDLDIAGGAGRAREPSHAAEPGERTLEPIGKSNRHASSADPPRTLCESALILLASP